MRVIICYTIAFQHEKKGAEALDRTMERFQMGPTYLNLVYKHPQYKVEGCWSYTERMILPSRGPFFLFWMPRMPTLPTEFELLWRNANCSRHVLIFCNWNSETLLEPWMATVMAVVLYHSLTYQLTQSQQQYRGVKDSSLIMRFWLVFFSQYFFWVTEKQKQTSIERIFSQLWKKLYLCNENMS